MPQASLDALKVVDLTSDQPMAPIPPPAWGTPGRCRWPSPSPGIAISDVKVTKHKEKQFYSSIELTTAQIIEKQGVRGVDTTSGATVTSEAIINATAKALCRRAK